MNKLFVAYEHPERGEEFAPFIYENERPEDARHRIISYLWNVENVTNIRFLTLAEFLVRKAQSRWHINRNTTIDEFQRKSKGGKGGPKN